MKKSFGFALAAILFGASFANAQEFTSLKQIADDGKYIDAYNIQGAYFEEAKNRGYHVIARGADKFDVVGYQDGLPGAGWDRSKARFFGTGELSTANSSLRAKKWISRNTKKTAKSSSPTNKKRRS